ncbi:PstS family phosphate ABC transporter substrate-binding protein [Tepidibacter formicigenes]|uniref:Phosphate-binding protein n=1 Tax=Tepidibacter formicigenes DSM 15518 TaxID=1123349 RepID=A0A1M6LAY7_9FIRM|nr:PstS family phosphate ABC transporter substrate-binding protein [Tepidibacter formicigenes]SHJ68332.1 phosphate ABC transporter substrate-binding protein, PhoT family (TC 3.A.1.7.1) [Tepidibacter formicigenes DSM 15518]
MAILKGRIKKILFLGLIGVLSVGILAGCGAKSETSQSGLTGAISIDGSSTVYPISEAVAEEFQKMNPDVKVTVNFSGTGGGFEKFLVKETDINDASRPIKDKEIKKAQESGVEYTELKVAYDGLSVVVNKDNDFIDYLTMEELKKIWEPNSSVKTWKDVRAEWPAEPVKLYGPGSDSGTFEYFTEEVNKEAGAIRVDYTASEDDNVLVNGIAGDKYSLGFFGYAYYIENKDKLKVVPIDSGKGPVEPTPETVENGTYEPLSRPLFIYVNKESMQRPEIKEFVKYYLTEGKELIPEVGYVKLPQSEYDNQLSQIGE